MGISPWLQPVFSSHYELSLMPNISKKNHTCFFFFKVGFIFRTVLDMQKIYEIATETSPISSHPVVPSINSIHQYDISVISVNLSCNVILTKAHSLRSLVFNLMFFSLSVSRLHSGQPSMFRLVFLGSSWLWQFLRLFAMTLTVLGRAHQVFWRMSHCWDLYDKMGAMGVTGKKTAQVKCYFHHIISKIQTISMISDCWCWCWSPGWGRMCEVSPL